jgi:hypothetical protein
MQVSCYPTLDHPNDEDLSFHPSEHPPQRTLAGDPESLGTPKPQKQRRGEGGAPMT